MRCFILILVLSLFVLSNCRFNNHDIKQGIIGTWELNEFSTPDGSIEKSSGITKLTLTPEGAYIYYSQYNDVIVEVRGDYRVIDDLKFSTDRSLLILIDHPIINSFGDTTTHYAVSEIISVNENRLAIKHQTIMLPNDSLLKVFSKKEFYVRGNKK